MNISNLNKAAILIGRMADIKTPTNPIIPHKKEKPALGAATPDAFERCTPEEVGISSEYIRDFVEKLSQNKSLNMHSIIMSRDGKIFYEAAFGTHRLDVHKATFSLCKSVVSLLTGIAMDEGLISHDTRIIDIFSDLTNPIIRLKLKELTVWHLLTMQSGIRFNEAECMTDNDWVRAFLRSSTENMGKKFSYNSLNTYMLAAAIERVTGKSFKKYLEEKLFSPLGISQYHWEKCPSGTEKGGWGLYISPYDVLKLGMLALNGGKFNGKQIVSEQYITAATSFKVTTPSSCGAFDYGYQMWVGRDTDTFLFNGMFGQNCLCFKKNGIIIVSNAGCDELFQGSEYYKNALSFFTKTFPAVIKASPSKHKALLRYTDTLKYSAKKKSFLGHVFFGDRQGKNLKALCGQLFKTNCVNSTGLLPTVLQVVHNNYSSGLESLAFCCEDGKFYLMYNEFTARHKIPLELNGVARCQLSFDGDSYLVSTLCRFAVNEYGNTVFLIDLDFNETPCTRHLKLVFTDEEITIFQSEKPGKETVESLIGTFVQDLSEKPVISSVIEKLDTEYILYRTEKIFLSKHRLYLKK